MKISLNFPSQELRKIIDILSSNNGSPRIIGGAVRDSYLRKEFRDIDIASRLRPDEVTSIFESQGYKVIPTGIDHGTVTIHTKDGDFEITTLRKDIMTDGRRAIVEFTDDFDVDAGRRDFTINALSYDLINNELYDYFGGIADLDAAKVRFIGDPDSRIKEDYLRILRFFRFSVYYSNSIDENGLEASKNNAPQIVTLSKERIHQEFGKILSCPNDISYIIKAMEESLVLAYMSKGFDLEITGLINFEEKFHKDEQVKLFVLETQTLKILRLMFLLFSMGKKLMKEYMQILRFSNKEIDLCIVLYDFIANIIDQENKKEIYYELCKSWYYYPKEVDFIKSSSGMSSRSSLTLDPDLNPSQPKKYLEFASSQNIEHGSRIVVRDDNGSPGQHTPSVINYCLLITYILGSIDSKELFAGIEEMSSKAPVMPVPTEEIIKSGYEGIALGVRKKYLEKSWIKSGFSLSKEELINLK